MKVRIHFIGKIRSLPTSVPCVVAKARRAATHTAAAAAAVFISPMSLIQFKPLLIVLSIALVSCLVAAKQASGQSGPAAAALGEIIPLKIGDRVPDELWDQYFPVVSAGNDQTQMLSLGDFKDKLIILDFWATWCTSCIKAMPSLTEMQNRFPDKLKIIPVNSDSNGDGIKKFLNTNSTIKGLNMESIYNADILKGYFPYRLIPHYVWINPLGFVEAITGTEAITNENIVKILDSESPNLAVKKDIDRSKPLFLNDDLQNNDLLYYSILLKGNYSGLPSGTLFRRKENPVAGLQTTNTSLLTIYSIIANQIFRQNNQAYSSKKNLKIEVENPNDLEDHFNFEIRIPKKDERYLFNRALENLNNYTKYNGSIETRNEKAYILTFEGKVEKLKANKLINRANKDSPSAPVNISQNQLVEWLNSLEGIQYPFIDETGLQENYIISLFRVDNIEDVKNQLNVYGFRVRQENLPLTLFVIKDK